jgi:hypothetical protein
MPFVGASGSTFAHRSKSSCCPLLRFAHFYPFTYFGISRNGKYQYPASERSVDSVVGRVCREKAVDVNGVVWMRHGADDFAATGQL